MVVSFIHHSSFIIHHFGLVFLIGYRGTGKSTVARLLAERLGWEWADADEVLERRRGKSIRAVFAEEGEEGFREHEAAILKELCERRNVVIATGGGVVLRADNRQRMRDAGTVIWLTADVDTIWRRMVEDSSTGERRPALLASAEDPRQEIETLLHIREPLYRECSHCTVDTANRSPEEVVSAIGYRLSAIGHRPEPKADSQ